MSDTVKLTMEVEVPRDQLPPNYTGRLLWRNPVNNDFTIVTTADGMAVMKLVAGVEFSSPRIIVEVRQPWRVPDYLRDKRFNGWRIKQSRFGELQFHRPDSVTRGRTVIKGDLDAAFVLLGGKWNDFDEMEVNHFYALGEHAE